MYNDSGINTKEVEESIDKIDETVAEVFKEDKAEEKEQAEKQPQEDDTGVEKEKETPNTKEDEIDVDKLKKQLDDLKKKISKSNKAPKDVAEYDEAYQIDSTLKAFYDTEEGKKTLENFKTFAKDNDLSKEQYKATINKVNELLIANGIIDPRTQLEKEAEKAKWVQEQYKIIRDAGGDPVQTIKINSDFVINANQFNKSEKMELIKLIDSGVVGLNIVNKIRRFIDYDRVENTEIPINIQTDNDNGVNDLIQKMREEKDDSKRGAIFNKILKMTNGEIPEELGNFK